MKISLIGYGKTGERVAVLAKERGWEVVNVFSQTKTIQPDLLRGTVSIDFSTPSAFKENYETLFAFSSAVVIGTTGWGDVFEQVALVSKNKQCRGVYANNFSLGMNIFMKTLLQTSKYLAKYGYQAYLLEKHHQTKRDKPSGTALVLQEILLKNNLAVDLESIRCGEIKGEHEVGFESIYDQILLKHTCYSRDSFAMGALLAAEMLLKQTENRLYSFDELLVL